MTVVLPTSFGKADWTDYTDYWRDADATWLMERSVLRYASAATRATEWPTPTFGQVTYNEDALGNDIDRIEMYSKQHNKWVPLLMLANITSSVDTTAAVGLGHSLAGNKGVVFQPTQTLFDNPVDVMAGVFTVNTPAVPNAVGIRSTPGTKQVKLTTNATSLVSDSPITATDLTATGVLTAASATITTLTAPTINSSGTLTGATINGTSGTIGGVLLAGGTVQPASGAAGGMYAGQGQFYGDGTSAVMRQRASLAGAQSTNFLQVSSTSVIVGGTTGSLDVSPQTRVFSSRGIQWFTAASAAAGAAPNAWISPSLYSATDPGATNYPDGTIWVS